MNQAEEKLANWATWEVVRGLGGSLKSPKFRRAMLKYALESEEMEIGQ